MRNFVEPAGGGNLADFHPIIERVCQHRTRALQPELEHACREGHAGLLQQILNVTRGYAKLAGEMLRGERRIGKARGPICLRAAHPGLAVEIVEGAQPHYPFVVSLE